MVSPFGNYHNALLTVTEQGSDVELNEETGNWEVTGETTTVYQAYLKPGRPQTKPETGLDSAQIYLTGYLIAPMHFPNWLKLPYRFQCEVKIANGQTQKGIFEAAMVVGSAFGVEAIIGTKIEGLLTVEDGN